MLRKPNSMELAERDEYLLGTDAKREARQYAKFPDALRGAIVGAPADPEAFG